MHYTQGGEAEHFQSAEEEVSLDAEGGVHPTYHKHLLLAQVRWPKLGAQLPCLVSGKIAASSEIAIQSC